MTNLITRARRAHPSDGGDMTETMTFRCARCLANWQLTRDTNGRFVDADGKPAVVVCPECGPGTFLEIVEDFV